MGQEEYVLELNGIVKKYPGVTALNGDVYKRQQ